MVRRRRAQTKKGRFLGLVVNDRMSRDEKKGVALNVKDVVADLNKEKITRRQAMSTVGKVTLGAVAVVVVGGVTYFLTTQSPSSTTTSTTSSSTAQASTSSASTTVSNSATCTNLYNPINALGATPVINVDPGISVCFTELPLKMALYEPLIHNVPGTTQQVAPGLAQSWSSTDGKTWEVKLQPGVKFHDGTTLDANAVQYSFERTMTLNSTAATFISELGIKAGTCYNPSSFQVVDNCTFQIVFPNPIATYSFQGAFAYEIPLLPASPTYIQAHQASGSYGSNGDYGTAYMKTHEAGTGPYTMTQYVQCQYWVAERFSDYWRGWDQPQPQHLSQITFSFASQVATEKLDLVSKQDCWAETFNWPACVASCVASVQGISQSWQPGLDTATLHLDLRGDRPLKDVNLRKMLSYAFDYQGAIKNIYDCHVTQSHGPIPDNDFGWCSSVPQYSYDPTTASQYLCKAGYKPGELTLEGAYNQGFCWKGSTLQILQSNLCSIGVKLNITEVTSAAYFQGIQCNPTGIADIYPFIWCDALFDPVRSIIYKVYSEAPPNGLNLGYQNTCFDNLLNQTLTELCNTKAAADIGQLSKMLIQCATDVFLWSYTVPRAYWNWVKGYKEQLNAFNTVNWWCMWIDESAKT